MFCLQYCWIIISLCVKCITGYNTNDTFLFDLQVKLIVALGYVNHCTSYLVCRLSHPDMRMWMCALWRGNTTACDYAFSGELGPVSKANLRCSCNVLITALFNRFWPIMVSRMQYHLMLRIVTHASKSQYEDLTVVFTQLLHETSLLNVTIGQNRKHGLPLTYFKTLEPYYIICD